MSNEERRQELKEDMQFLCETRNDISTYEIVVRLIAQATKILLLNSDPKELVAIKTILAALQLGISECQDEEEEENLI